MIAFDRLDTRTTPLVIAHRGAPTIAHENTLESFDIAIKQGADAIELDLRRTADNTLIVHHDLRISRNLPRLGDQTYRQAGREARKRGFVLPTLEQVFDLCRDRIAINIELKEAGFESQLLEFVRSRFALSSLLFTSFLPEAIAGLKALEPAVTTGLLLGRVKKPLPRTRPRRPRVIDRVAACGADVVLPHKLRARTRFLKRLRDHQQPAIVWTVNSPRTFHRLTTLGVVGIITDRPDLLRTYLDSR